MIVHVNLLCTWYSHPHAWEGIKWSTGVLFNVNIYSHPHASSGPRSTCSQCNMVPHPHAWSGLIGSTYFYSVRTWYSHIHTPGSGLLWSTYVVCNVNMVLTSTRLKRAQYDPPYLSTNMQFHIHTPEGYNMIHPCSSTMHMEPAFTRLKRTIWSTYVLMHNMVLTSQAWSGQQNDPPMPITMHMVLSHLHAWSGYDNDPPMSIYQYTWYYPHAWSGYNMIHLCSFTMHMVLTSTRLKRYNMINTMFYLQYSCTWYSHLHAWSG
jgi:hypothetical protein